MSSESSPKLGGAAGIALTAMWVEHREYPAARTPHGMISSGRAGEDAATQRAVADSVITAVFEEPERHSRA